MSKNRAVLILSYGGPENMSQVGPFLDRILAGRPVPEPRRLAVIAKYAQFNGKSPLNGETAKFAAALAERFGDETGGVFCGNLFAEPLLPETLNEMADRGIDTVQVFIASAFKTKSSFDRYRDRLFAAAEETALRRKNEGKPVPRWSFAVLPPYYQDELFIQGVSDTVLAGRAPMELDSMTRPELAPFVLFSAHALPENEAAADGYREQLLNVCTKTAALTGLGAPFDGNNAESGVLTGTAGSGTADSSRWPWKLVFQSRSGSPRQPWTGPEIGETLRQIHALHPELNAVLAVPAGFFFDNMETVCDLDIETAAVCRELGIAYYRSPAVGSMPRGVKLAHRLLINQNFDQNG